MAAKELSAIQPEWIEDFRSSGDTLRVYQGAGLIFSSGKDRLTPLLEYINKFASTLSGVYMLDRVVGNAAALLLKKARCREIFSEIGSEPAALTLSGAGIAFHFDQTVPFIINEAGDGMCPMEKLSLGKEPEEFLRCLS